MILKNVTVYIHKNMPIIELHNDQDQLAAKVYLTSQNVTEIVFFDEKNFGTLVSIPNASFNNNVKDLRQNIKEVLTNLISLI